MPGITFDTLESVKALRAAGFQEAQAEALVGEIKKLQDTAIVDLATKGDISTLRAEIRELELRLENKFESIKGEMLLLKWMIGFVLAGIVSLILKTFFG